MTLLMSGWQDLLWKKNNAKTYIGIAYSAITSSFVLGMDKLAEYVVPNDRN